MRHCFASAFDERVFVYKREHGFDVLSPRIAVVVQQQIASEVAGVGFSLNPLTNDYDEAVIDANWGLGESVVAGLASPDHFVVDKVSGKHVQKKLGAKQVSIWLGSRRGHGGARRIPLTDLTLSEAQLGEIVDAAVSDRGALRTPDGHRVGLRRWSAPHPAGAPHHRLRAAPA